MATDPTASTNRSKRPSTIERRHPRLDAPVAFDAPAMYRTEIARLNAELVALRYELERQRRKRQTIVDHYERLLAAREREREAADDECGSSRERNGVSLCADGGLVDRFLR